MGLTSYFIIRFSSYRSKPSKRKAKEINKKINEMTRHEQGLLLLDIAKQIEDDLKN